MQNSAIQPGVVHGFTQKFNRLVTVLESRVLIAQAFDPFRTSPPPDHREYHAIWDTGATGSVITSKVVQECGLKPISIVQVHVVGAVNRSPVYLVNVVLPNKVGVSSLRVTEARSIHGADVLIGMDIIGRGDFAVCNYQGKTTMSFRMPSCGCVDFKDFSTPAKASTTPAQSNKISRNSPCPCGSGKKYKKCCGA